MDFTTINPRDQRWWQHRYAANGGEEVGFLIVPHAAIDASFALKNAIDDGIRKGVTQFAWGDNTVVPIFRSKVTMEHIDMAIQSGGEVYDLPTYIEVDSVDDALPEAWATEEVTTWAEWMVETFSAIERDGRTFISSSARTLEPMLLSEMVAADVTIVLPQDLPPADESPN